MAVRWTAEEEERRGTASADAVMTTADPRVAELEAEVVRLWLLVQPLTAAVQAPASPTDTSDRFVCFVLLQIV